MTGQPTDLHAVVAALALPPHELLTPARAERIIATATDAERVIALLLAEVQEADLRAAIAAEAGFDYIDLNTPDCPYTFEPVLLAGLSVSTLEQLEALPLRTTTARGVAVAVADNNPDVAKVLRPHFEQAGYTFKIIMAPRDQILSRLTRARTGGSDQQEPEETQAPDATTVAASAAATDPLVQQIDDLLERAVAEGASDIHLLLREGSALDVRFRIDGLMVSQPALGNRATATRVLNAVINKTGTMDSANRRTPQDGTFSFTTLGRSIDVRVASLPTIDGGRVTMRLLDSDNVKTRLEDTGLPADVLGHLRAAVTSRQGTVLFCGPTGSGKTTTLYALLREIDARVRNVLTAEDPVEYRIPDISQTQIRAGLGEKSLTYAKAVTAMMRQDPDVILIGEIRDEETAEAVMQAAMTGHLVLSTVHANSSPEIFTRLLDLNVKPFTVGRAVSMAVSQRLVRRVHDCALPAAPSPADKQMLQQMNLPTLHTVQRITGCQGCNYTGYRGRVAVVELLRVTPEIQALLEAHAPVSELAHTATKQGYKPLLESAFEHVVSGVTTVAEVYDQVASITERGQA